MIDLDKLTNDVREARTAAERALVGQKDGGSCNHDAAFISMRPSRSREAAISAGGLTPYQRKGGYELAMMCGGQGSRVTVAAETIAETLRSRGWDASVLYRVD